MNEQLRHTQAEVKACGQIALKREELLARLRPVPVAVGFGLQLIAVLLLSEQKSLKRIRIIVGLLFSFCHPVCKVFAAFIEEIAVPLLPEVYGYLRAN